MLEKIKSVASPKSADKSADKNVNKNVNKSLLPSANGCSFIVSAGPYREEALCAIKWGIEKQHGKLYCTTHRKVRGEKNGNRD